MGASGYVIPMVLPEQVVYNLPDYMLKELPECTSDILLKYINSYIETNENSGNEVSQRVATRLKSAYSYRNARIQFLKEEGTQEIVELLSNLTLEDISIAVDEETLIKWKNAITFVFESDKIEAMKHVVTKQAYEHFRARVSDIPASCTEVESQAVYRMLSIMEENKSLFKSAPFTRLRGTPFRGILLRKEVYELILYGIDYILDKKRKGLEPISWRLL